MEAAVTPAPSERPCWSCGSPCKRVGLIRSWDQKRLVLVVFECPACRYEFVPFFPEDGALKVGRRRFALPFKECR